ncbi:hypothetical protein L211DRAFT_334681 [Terfezia boudieri ATCC MYA-4762]|uniref:Uncharacterized protein n=1 Tax=Terfezia boudieri ATCC MYA-4762 TaxID=1051890 RepID=A0A3N4LKU2_9PEZI|nr:hypothetical protein L211DRAFT_334681 [Terfezia boudieri ATCC MYA-4762]
MTSDIDTDTETTYSSDSYHRGSCNVSSSSICEGDLSLRPWAAAVQSSRKAVCCLREHLMFINGNVERIFRDDAFTCYAEEFNSSLDEGGAAWVNSTPPVWPTYSASQRHKRPENTLDAKRDLRLQHPDHTSDCPSN